MNPKSLVQEGVHVEHLKIGECIFTRNPMLISTVLGSCVGISFHCPEFGYSALFHSMLPDSAMAKAINRKCNYVDLAVNSIMDKFRMLEIAPSSITAKLFGGANTMRPEERGLLGEMLDVGKKNVEQAEAELLALGIEPVVRDVQGAAGRKIFFYTVTGEVWLKRLPATLSRNKSMA